jgi:hypothetical protein
MDMILLRSRSLVRVADSIMTSQLHGGGGGGGGGQGHVIFRVSHHFAACCLPDVNCYKQELLQYFVCCLRSDILNKIRTSLGVCVKCNIKYPHIRTLSNP